MTTAAGPCPPSRASVTPLALSAPTAPTNVTASPASGQALVTWTAPGNGGSSLTGYTITPYIGGAAQTPVQVVNGSATSAIVTGLTTGANYTFTVSATNNIGTGPGSTASNTVSPADTIFDFSSPGTGDSGDGSAAELGVQFTSSVQGWVTGIRFYKAAANTGTHVGHLWTAGGQLLASVTFANETASGWQTALFSNPVQINPGTTYVASYYAPNGHYSVTSPGFNSAVTNPPLQAPANGSTANGVFSYGSLGTFPSSSYNASNYWVDVMFVPTAVPGQVTGVSATAGQGSATVSWSAPSSGGAPTSYTITPYIGSTAQTPTHDHRQPARHHRHDLQPHPGHRLHLHSAGERRQRQRPGVRGIERRHADRAQRLDGADERDGEPGLRPGPGQLDGAEQQRRRDDHRVHDHPVHRRDGKVAGQREQRLGHLGHRHRPDERDELHVHRGCGEQRRDRPGIERERRGRPG